VVSEDGLTKRGLNPYSNQWDILATRTTSKQAWIPHPPFDELDKTGNLKFDISKYKTAKHSARQLMGWDAAIRRADQDDQPIRWCVLTEGSLDAGRIGPGGLTLMGKSISKGNAIKAVCNFHLVLTAFDNDTAGIAATEQISQAFANFQGRSSQLKHVERLIIPTGKDLGDLDLLRQTINREMRHLDVFNARSRAGANVPEASWLGKWPFNRGAGLVRISKKVMHRSIVCWFRTVFRSLTCSHRNVANRRAIVRARPRTPNHTHNHTHTTTHTQP
jgi:hypothetical protein